jgi:hypothetical protein
LCATGGAASYAQYCVSFLGRTEIPGFAWLSAKKIIRTRAIKNRRFFASKTRNRFKWRSIAARAAQKPERASLRHTPVWAKKSAPIFFALTTREN